MKRIRAGALSLLQRLRAIPAERKKLFLLLLFPVLVFTVVTATDAYRDWKRAGGDLPLNCTFDREHHVLTIYAQHGTRIDHYYRFAEPYPPLPSDWDPEAAVESEPQAFSFQLFDEEEPECLVVFVYPKGSDALKRYEFYINRKDVGYRVVMCLSGGITEEHEWMF